ncbi:MAG: hypothetical protein V2I33_25075 [Kangiellaceae bacterium]|jgi:hypothetical protein|nr:hypothetical protein [Kangiellaceae bacterium]
MCGRKDRQYICTDCSHGLGYFPDSYICSKEGATGLEQLTNKNWVVLRPKTGEFVFVQEGIFGSVGYGEVNLSSQRLDVEAEATDMIIRESRGLWFDGVTRALRTQGLWFYHTFTVSAWIQPNVRRFAIFSASDIANAGNLPVYSFICHDGQLQFQFLDEINVETQIKVLVRNGTW